jgi:riboflavin biosynthesis pyrimidine reductase
VPSPVDWYETQPGFAANFHLTETGAYYGSTKSSRDISNEVDLAHLKQLRAGADAVVIGGATARAEGYKPSSKFKTYVFSRKPQSTQLEHLSFDNEDQLLEQLAFLKSSHSRVLSECGPSLLNKFLDLGAVDQLFLTVSFDSVPSRQSAEHVAKRVLSLDSYQVARFSMLENSALMLWRRA